MQGGAMLSFTAYVPQEKANSLPRPPPQRKSFLCSSFVPMPIAKLTTASLRQGLGSLR